jgi:two-component system chemotaxis response regulator CheB
MLQIRRDRAERMKQRASQPLPVAMPSKPVAAAPQYADKLIAIGVSTGGPPALATLFKSLPPPLPPIVVVQHMPPDFTQAFAWRLNSISSLSVKEAESGDVVQPNNVYIAQGGKHLYLRKEGAAVKCLVRDGDPVSGHKPSVDVMMKCAAEIYASRCLGVVMTGMGRDGSDGCGAIRKAGGFTLGQDEASSDVYGMNKVAFAEGNVDRQFHLDEAAAVIATQVRRMWDRATAGV